MSRPTPGLAATPQLRRDRRAGVTLLELLVSLAMMAALALILGTTLDMTARGAARLGSETDRLGVLLDREVMRRWIEGIPLKATFSGTAERLRFETLIDEPPFWVGELTQVALEQHGDGAGGAVKAFAKTPGGEGPGRELLLSGTSTGLALAYWGSISAGESRRWHADWPASAGLPELVRISYDLDGHVLPPLSVRPARAAHQSKMSLSSLVPPG